MFRCEPAVVKLHRTLVNLWNENGMSAARCNTTYLTGSIYWTTFLASLHCTRQQLSSTRTVMYFHVNLDCAWNTDNGGSFPIYCVNFRCSLVE